MPPTETIDIELKGRRVRGTLHRPDKDGEKPLAAALICISPDGLPSEAGLTEALATALVDAGVAAVVYHAGPAKPADAADRALWLHAVDDAAAVFRWIALHDKIDLARLGVIGYGRGAIVASCLSRRTDQIAGLCLIAPCAKYTASANGEKDEPAKADASALHPAEDAAHFDRPTYMLIGGGDEVIPFADSQVYLNALENVEHQVQHLIIARADHGFTDEPLRALCVRQVVGFFQQLPALEHAEPHL